MTTPKSLVRDSFELIIHHRTPLLTGIGIFLGAVWAYILLFVFLGPEMTQEERNKEAATAEEFEEMRARGIHLAEIGIGRARMEDKLEKMDSADEAEHVEEKTAAGHIGEA